MHYILMHQEVEVALLDVDKGSGTITSILKIYNKNHYPCGVSETEDDLNMWMRSRLIPSSRKNLDELILHTPAATVSALSLQCFGLSLIDQYWLNPESKRQEWKDINFFDNDFSEDIGHLLVGNYYDGSNINIRSPDCTTNGVLTKRWKIVDGKRVLFKAGSSSPFQEVYNEVIASELLKRLGIEHVHYDIIWDADKVYCTSEDYINRNIEFVGAWFATHCDNTTTCQQFYNKYVEFCETHKLHNQLDEMLIIDYLLANTDRHTNNFGFIRDATTLEWLGPAPIYDTGSSLGYDVANKNIVNGKLVFKPFMNVNEQQLAMVTSFSLLKVSALNNFDLFIRKILAECDDDYSLGQRKLELIITAYLYRRNKLLEHVLSTVEYAINISPYMKDLVKQSLAEYKVDADYHWFELHTKQEAMELIGTLS